MTARHVSYSEISSYRKCPHLHRLEYKDRWRAETTSPALAKGSLWHKVMEWHYGQLLQAQAGILTPTDVGALLVGAEDIWRESEHADLLRWMYRGYLETYELDESWTIIAVESQHEFWLPTAWGSRAHTRLKMIVDLVVRDSQNRIWLVDHKTGKDLPNEYELDLDDQFTLYAWGLGQLGYDIHGIIYNACRTQQNKGFMPIETRFQRLPLYRTPEQLQNTAVDAWRTARRAYAVTPGREERALGLVPCLRPYRCAYAEACIWARKGGDEEDFLRSSGFMKREKR
jgi:RecB family exonuclease